MQDDLNVGPSRRDHSETPRPDIAALITERRKTHGEYSLEAKVAIDIQNAIFWGPSELCPEARLALIMIATKISRITCGDPDFADHWRDIAGYATLVADRCTK